MGRRVKDRESGRYEWDDDGNERCWEGVAVVEGRR